eukprot:CAMPEP_0185835452 /NCGR_PEP_ID=MMETSP1353-20130828/7792_1 /TAXON_ID=1077150 /ORGANISM="Erythrolobus australicus, Strain CCMP3124" /LENGTH=53 /DNA_ID=CAMNT_0028534079 /DNA_START=52 /DNA_END=210 /DNA_ORIENTATION=-
MVDAVSEDVASGARIASARADALLTRQELCSFCVQTCTENTRQARCRSASGLC